MASPRRATQPPPVTRNAEELACHVLHGSLRLTPSRQQILSHSGIRLDERTTAAKDEAPPIDHAPTEMTNRDASTAAETQPQGPAREESREEEEGAQPTHQRGSRKSQQPPIQSTAQSESYIAKISKKARRIKHKKMTETNDGGRVVDSGQRRRAPTRRRLESAESVSGNEQPAYPQRTHILEQQIKTRGESSAARAENPSENHASEERERPLRSPFSDTGVYRRRLASSTVSDSFVPNASGPDDLTVRSASLSREQQPQRKRKQSASSVDGGTNSKRKKLVVSRTDSRQGKGLNGLVNGREVMEFKPLDLVWAKCRGYPSYPALVSHQVTRASCVHCVTKLQSLVCVIISLSALC